MTGRGVVLTAGMMAGLLTTGVASARAAAPHRPAAHPAQAAAAHTSSPGQASSTGQAQGQPPVTAGPVAAAPATPDQTTPVTPPPALPVPAAARLIEAQPVPPVKARYFVQVMEGILERAVRYAASQMNRKLQAVSPELLQLSGAARARGFRLDGYGVFFDVEVPAALRQTMGFTARMMQQHDQTLEQALTSLRRLTNDLEGKRRVDADTALKLLELRVRPAYPRPNVYAPLLTADRQSSGAVQATSAGVGPSAGDGSLPPNATPVATGTAAQAAPPPAAPQPTAEDLAWMQNPDGAYEMEVRDALIGAMLGYGSTLALRPDEWLTVAARDNQTVVVPGDLSETVTVILRIKGSDLAELVAGRLTEAEARRRIEVREF